MHTHIKTCTHIKLDGQGALRRSYILRASQSPAMYVSPCSLAWGC